MLNRISIELKILLLGGISLFFLVIISLSSYVGISSIGKEIEELAEYQITLNSNITKIQAELLKEESLTYKLILSSSDVNSEEFKYLKKELNDIDKVIEKSVKECVSISLKAINHNDDLKIKKQYQEFSKGCLTLKNEQSVFHKNLINFEDDLSNGNLVNIKNDKDKLIKELLYMDKFVENLTLHIKELVNKSSHQAEEDEQTVLNVIGIISVLAFILSNVFAFFIIKNIKLSIRSFQSGLLSFFSYLNKETDKVDTIKINSKDEIGLMTDVVNKNIIKTKTIIEEDKVLIEDVRRVVVQVNKGYLNQVIEKTTNNESLEELKNEFNIMLNNISNNICLDLNKITAILEKFSDLDFRDRVINDEGNVSKGLNNLADIINNMLVENKSNGLALSDSSASLLKNVDLLYKNSNEAASSLEETAAALEEITSTIISNTENVVKMSNNANELKKSSSEGEKLAKETTISMDEINEQVMAINNAIGVIDQISFQTNILSLNAAVEAATAGEAGKGFAIVAQEVRSLATRSADAANEIKNLVESATKKANNGKSISDKMISGYEGLNENIHKTLDLISDVEHASKEQKNGIEQINYAVSQLDQQTQHNAAIANETQDIANYTDEIAKLIVGDANEKEFIGKNEVQAKVLSKI